MPRGSIICWRHGIFVYYSVSVTTSFNWKCYSHLANCGPYWSCSSRYYHYYRNVKLAGYSVLDIGHSNVQCPISNIQPISRSPLLLPFITMMASWRRNAYGIVGFCEGIPTVIGGFSSQIRSFDVFSYEQFVSPVHTLLHTLLWHHNGRNGVSNHQPHDCLLNHSFKLRSNKTSKLGATGLCAGNSPVTGEFPAQMASNAENVSIWWRHLEE